MTLLILFALVAGAATALSPCVLPVLPIALAAGATGGRRRPLGVVVGLAFSFTFATVALVYLISALGLPDDLLRTFAVTVLILFGLTLMVPKAAERLEGWMSRFTPKGPAATGDGFGSGMMVGFGLGFVYAPCAGPILAGVITVSAAQPFTAGRLVVAVAYGIGSAAALYVLMLGGRRLTRRLAARSVGFQIAMGGLMVLTGLAMLGNLDTRFETAIASDLPAFLVGPAGSLEKSAAATSGLKSLHGGAKGLAPAGKQAGAVGGHPSNLPVLGVAPEFTGNQQWFNTPRGQPLTLAGLRGRVVLVDFWTYSCINCLRTLPYLRAWDAKYRSRGLTIVGVHSPEFPFEKSADNVRTAISENGLKYPVAQDNNLETWNAYSNRYWPAEYLIDTQGRVRFEAFGEGDDVRRENAIRSLLAERSGAKLGRSTKVRAQTANLGTTTPESYLGAARADRFTNGQIPAGNHAFGPQPGGDPPADHLRYWGNWSIGELDATARAGAGIDLRFSAQRVFLVLGSPGRSRTVRLLLDGRPVTASAAGPDVHGSSVKVGFQRLYRLINLPEAETHTLTVLPQAGVNGYAFTFG